MFELTGVGHEFCLIALESVAPYTVQAAPLSPDAIDAGRDQYKSILKAVRDCEITDDWPGVDSPAKWQLPSWAAAGAVELEIDGELLTIS